MTTKEPIVHQSTYFESIKRFYPHLNTSDNKKIANKGKGIWTRPQKGYVPEPLEAILVSTLNTLETLVRSGSDPSIPPYLRLVSTKKCLTLLYEDSEVEASANNSEFIELIQFYDDLFHVQAGRALNYLENHGDDFFIISASTPEGSPLIMNYVFPASQLATFITTLTQDVTQPIQEILAYKTSNLYSALILASSKPF